MKKISISTKSRTELIDITHHVAQAVKELGIKDGFCTIFIPHTTAGITINENADPSVGEDILMKLNKLIPFENGYSHIEGNAAAHIKASVVDSSLTVIIEDGRLCLGTWQGIFFCEFDGPRSRQIWIKITT